MASRNNKNNKGTSKKTGFFAPNDSTSSLKASGNSRGNSRGNSPVENSDERKLLSLPQMLAYKAAGMASTEATSLQEKIFKGVLLQQMVQTNECNLQKNRNEELEELNKGLRDALLEQRRETRTVESSARTAAIRKTIAADAPAGEGTRKSVRLQEKKSKGFMSLFSSKGGQASRKKRSYGKYKSKRNKRY
jgi:hypothetical protein